MKYTVHLELAWRMAEGGKPCAGKENMWGGPAESRFSQHWSKTVALDRKGRDI